MPHEPTASQDLLISKLSEFLTGARGNKALIVKGYAGTGKTTAVAALVRTMDTLDMKSVLLAPTGRAAKVFSGYAGKQAYTIHRKIYIQKSAKDAFGEFVLTKNLYRNTVFMVDESSMISNEKPEDSVFGTGRLLDDLVSFVKSGINCSLILIGDTAQLPPVGIALSPALESKELSSSFSSIEEIELTEVVRQAQRSGILVNATLIRNMIAEYRNNTPLLKHSRMPDVFAVYGNDVAEAVERAYDHYGIGETIVICRSNKRANQYNKGIRNSILAKEEGLAAGDLLMVVRNNYYCLNDQPDIEFVANGDIVQVVKIFRYVDRYDFHFAFVRLLLTDYQIEFDSWILLDTLMAESPSLPQEDNKRLYYNIIEDFKHIKSRRKQYTMVREDQFFNALQVKFAYAVTCHKAQGGQWKAVFVDQGYIKPESADREYLRWLYTAVTRTTEKLYLVNFPDFFLESTT